LGYYQKVKCVIFPSKLETWGLPITEAKELKKPLILSDLSYAHETLGNYEKVLFFNPDSAQELAKKMELIILNNSSEIKYEKIQQNNHVLRLPGYGFGAGSMC